ncbi:MAG: hypothetical protein ACR2RE_16085, partial [Geminicoccaceae bacterium]
MTTCSADRAVSEPVGAEAISEIGVPRIAEKLGISEQAVRKWRRKKSIPDERQDAIRRLLMECRAEVAMEPRVAEVSVEPTVSPPSPKTETCSPRPLPVTPKPSQQPITISPATNLNLTEVSGKQVGATARLLIAARDVKQNQVVAEQAAVAAEGLPPTPPVTWYRTRLAILFALDFPILAMAFAAVTQVSPIIAAGSATALSLGLVLCAHAAGGRLRRLAAHLPSWCADVVGIMVMLGLIAAVLAVATDLRLKGFELDHQLLAEAGVGLFAPEAAATSELPEAFVWAVVRSAGLVTLLVTVFGISWSYQQHSPQNAFAQAEASYRNSVLRYARAAKRAKLPSMVFAGLAFMIVVASGPSLAKACEGPVHLALIDTTTAYDDEDRRVIQPAIETMVCAVPGGNRLIIKTVRNSPESSRLLLDSCRPTTKGFEWTLADAWAWLNTNPADKRRMEAAFLASVRDALLPQLKDHGETDGTALLATLTKVIRSTSDIRSIWLFSDLLESEAITAHSLLSDPTSLIMADQELP